MNNGQATHGARKHAWRTQAAWAKREKEEERTMVITMAKLHMAHASTHGARMAHASRLGQYNQHVVKPPVYYCVFCGFCF